MPPRSNAAVKVVEIASSESANRNPKQKPHGSLVHSGIVEEGTIVETSTHVVSCARIVHRPGLDAYGFVVGRWRYLGRSWSRKLEERV